MRLRKRKLEPNGYAVMTADRDGYSFSSHVLDECKRFCYGDRIVVRKYRYRTGGTMSIRFHPELFGWDFKRIRARTGKSFCIGPFTVSWNKEYSNHYGETVFENLSEES